MTPSAGPTRDPWEQERRTDANAANKLLQRVLMAKMASHGCKLPLDPPTDPPTRGIDLEIVRAEFYAQVPAEGSEKQKRDSRPKRFESAIERAQRRLLIGVQEIGDNGCSSSTLKRANSSREQTRFAVSLQVPKMAIMAEAARSSVIDNKCYWLKHLHEG